jgi:5-methylcytosine-specific restriction endonuclease McrA
VSSRKISDLIQQQVRQRALELCEYCHASEKWQYVLFTVDHVIPLSKNGTDTINNLALYQFNMKRHIIRPPCSAPQRGDGEAGG